MPEGNKTVPLQALLDDAPRPDLVPDPRDQFADADVIVAVDAATGRETLVYGREALESVVDRGAARALHVMYVEIDEDSQDLQRLCDLARTVRGRCDCR